MFDGGTPRGGQSMMWLPLLMISLIIPHGYGQRFLTVVDKELRLNGEKVFMSGMNLAWHHYGMDFGNGRYDCCTGNTLEDYLRRVADKGGNSMRVWIHCGGKMTPKFDSSGYVVASDDANSLAKDLARFLDKAQSYNILVFPVLWNGAVAPRTQMKNLIWDDSKLTSYIEKVLKPLVRALKNKRALGGWDIMNEPEGLLTRNQAHTNPCFDTSRLAGSGAGWTHEQVPMYRLLRFINRQIAAIKEEDNKALATVGAWSERSQSNGFGFRNYYTDRCLIAAGGQWSGTLDFYQMHTYANSEGNKFTPSSPLKVHNDQHQIDKPNIIGELSQSGGDGADITAYINHAYYHGYSGAWSWQANGGGEHSDDFNTQARGLLWLRGRNDQRKGGRISVNLN